MTTIEHPVLSARITEQGTVFTVWAPEKPSMQLHIVAPVDEVHEMQEAGNGYWTIQLPAFPAGTLYYFRPGGEKDYPDPASGYQPEGVHGPSAVVDHQQHAWTDQAWKGIPLEDYIIYELHVGTFTEEGSFEAVIPRLDDLVSLGINAIEIMPVAQFPGERNWGYDGVYPFAVQQSYGGPAGLKKLVDACHNKGIAVILDVVYNHLGPEGNYLSVFAPYFSGRYHTLWGDAINFDWEWSDGVRHYFAENTLYWLEHFHVDALRYDAIHAIFDFSPVHFWEFLHKKVKALEAKLDRRFFLIAESDLNDPRALDLPAKRGFGFDAQWLDDFHHSLYKLIYPADQDRYNDFGLLQQLAKCIRDGFVHCGDEWVPSRKRCYGGTSAGFPGHKFVAFFSNHDQVGNRPDGARPSMFLDSERLKLAAAALLLSPYIPMIFMGEEYAADTPFYYFVSHSDPGLVEAVRKGRKEEFRDAGFHSEPPDAQAAETFNNSKLQWEKRNNARMLAWYEALIKMRKTLEPFRNLEKKDLEVHTEGDHVLIMNRRNRKGDETITCYFNFSESGVAVIYNNTHTGKKILDSKESRWMEATIPGSSLPASLAHGQSVLLPPLCVAVYSSRRGKNIE